MHATCIQELLLTVMGRTVFVEGNLLMHRFLQPSKQSASTKLNLSNLIFAAQTVAAALCLSVDVNVVN